MITAIDKKAALVVIDLQDGIVTFASDAMTDMVLSAHENSLNVIFPRIGEVDTTEAIINYLSGGSK